jgi:hypothetical protein
LLSNTSPPFSVGQKLCCSACGLPHNQPEPNPDDLKIIIPQKVKITTTFADYTICLTCSVMFLWRKKQAIHASTSTPCPNLHGVMQGMWRKTHIPQPNRRRETLQTQKAATLYCCLVEILKPPHPYKEQKQF